MPEYKKDDKVVFKIDADDAYWLNKGYGPSFCNDQFLGKLKDFQPKEDKIKLTKNEKREFDDFKDNYFPNNDYLDMLDMIDGEYPNLCRRFFDMDVAKSRKAQYEFIRALEEPELIEVGKDEKHSVKIGTSFLCRNNNGVFGFDDSASNNHRNLTLEEVKEAETQLGIQGLQSKWYKAQKKGE